MADESRNQIVVTGYGLHSSLGSDAVQSAALARAGLNSFQKSRRGPYTVAKIDSYWDDDSWLHKVEFLLAAPLFEAVFQARAVELLAQRRVGVFCALPNRAREGTDGEQLAALPERLQQMFAQLGTAPSLHIAHADHTATFAALAAARQQLMRGDIELALLIALDSQLHGPHLQALAKQGRVKGERVSSGIIPGDACAVLVLESARHAMARAATMHARLGVVAEADEGAPFRPDAPIRGEALSRALRAVLEHDDASACKDVFVDLTGERWRFLDWALAETRCLASLPYGYQLHHPADCLGDTGAASGATMIVLAMRAFARKYASGTSALLIASNDAGQRAAMLVHAVEAR